MGRYTVHLVDESNFQPAVQDLNAGDPIALIPEPAKKLDPHAIKAVAPSGETIGYLESGSWLQNAINFERATVYATVAAIIGDAPSKPCCGVVLEVLTAKEAKAAIAAAEAIVNPPEVLASGAATFAGPKPDESPYLAVPAPNPIDRKLLKTLLIGFGILLALSIIVWIDSPPPATPTTNVKMPAPATNVDMPAEDSFYAETGTNDAAATVPEPVQTAGAYSNAQKCFIDVGLQSMPRGGDDSTPSIDLKTLDYFKNETIHAGLKFGKSEEDVMNELRSLVASESYNYESMNQSDKEKYVKRKIDSALICLNHYRDKLEKE